MRKKRSELLETGWNVRSYGAKGDKQANDKSAIQQAVDDCNRAGGGTVVVSSGDYLTGTIRLRDHVTLQLEAGATLWGSTDRADYDDVPHLAEAIRGSSAVLIYAKGAQNVSILGPGCIDGQGEAFWVRKGDWWHQGKWRPGRLIYFEECRDVLMRDFTATNSPSFTIHPFRCDNVVISGVKILNDIYGPNTDGIDTNCSTNVHISDCHIIAGDDCIVLKATEPYVCENITVTNCTLETTSSGLKLGTESHADIRHCTFSNCTIRNTHLGIALQMKDGGTMEAVTFSNITMETKPSLKTGAAEWPIVIDLERRGPDSKTGVIRDVKLSNIVISTGGRCVVQGMKSQPIERLVIENVTVRVTGFQDLNQISKHRGGRVRWDDPDGGQHAAAPAHMVFSNVKDLKLRDVEVVVEAEGDIPERSAVFADRVSGMKIEGFGGRQSVPNGTSPALHLQNCRDAQITGSRASAETGTFVRLDGTETANVCLMGNNLAAVGQAVSLGDGVSEDILFETGNRKE